MTTLSPPPRGKWTSQDIDDLQLPPTWRELKGYGINIRQSLMTDDLEEYAVAPKSPARRFGDDLGNMPSVVTAPESDRPGKLDFSQMTNAKPTFADTVFLVFPDLETAIGTSLGQYWEWNKDEAQ
jgi:hypothetical protein